MGTGWLRIRSSPLCAATVPVFADEEPKRRWQYYEVLASVESDISDENKVNILLVPASTPAPAHG